MLEHYDVLYFSKKATQIDPIPYPLIMQHCHSSYWELGSMSSLLVFGQGCDYRGSDGMWFPRVGPQRWYGFCLDLLGCSAWNQLPYFEKAKQPPATANKPNVSPSQLLASTVGPESGEAFEMSPSNIWIQQHNRPHVIITWWKPSKTLGPWEKLVKQFPLF